MASTVEAVGSNSIEHTDDLYPTGGSASSVLAGDELGLCLIVSIWLFRPVGWMTPIAGPGRNSNQAESSWRLSCGTDDGSKDMH